ncbi:DUF952 domain-containing protein [Pararhizobium sp. LjRoot238]|uniref:DUF952 domain-containing protein n=1 Tax=Pararhizobium sp. LjRoot238 TaxID=3342293 RepID=UPI003ECEAF45
MSSIIYKIVPATLWQDALNSGEFKGAAIDLTDGYIHLSTAEQAPGTAARYFAGQQGLLLVAVDGEKLGDKLVYEASRDGTLFPHLYAPLSFDAVLWAKPLPLDANGTHLFPQDVFPEFGR